MDFATLLNQYGIWILFLVFAVIFYFAYTAAQNAGAARRQQGPGEARAYRVAGGRRDQPRWSRPAMGNGGGLEYDAQGRLRGWESWESDNDFAFYPTTAHPPQNAGEDAPPRRNGNGANLVDDDDRPVDQPDRGGGRGDAHPQPAGQGAAAPPQVAPRPNIVRRN